MTKQILYVENELLPEFRFQCTKFKIATDVWLCGRANNPKDENGDIILRGCYPLGFLKRMKDSFYFIFKDLKRNDILFVCSGSVPKQEGMRLDKDNLFKPDYLADAENMHMIPDNTFRWVTSDTPYNEDASDKYYKKPLLNKSKVLREMTRVTKVGGFVSLLDESFPVSPPRNLKCVARIAVSSVPNLTFRCFTAFRKES